MNKSKEIYTVLNSHLKTLKGDEPSFDIDQEIQVKFLILSQKVLQKNKGKEESSPQLTPSYSTQQLEMNGSLLKLFQKDSPLIIKGNNCFDTSKSEIRVGFIGNYNAGKTFLINQLFCLDLPLTHTANLTCISLGNMNIKIIDTPGLNNPSIEKNERKNREHFYKSLVLKHCNIVIYVVNSSDRKAKREMEEIKRECALAKANLIIIHNLFHIASEEEYDSFIDSHYISKKIAFKVNNNALSEVKGDAEFVHFVLGHSSSFMNYYDVIRQIQQQIEIKISLPSIQFKEMIKNTIVMCANTIFKVTPEVKENCIIEKAQEKVVQDPQNQNTQDTSIDNTQGNTITHMDNKKSTQSNETSIYIPSQPERLNKYNRVIYEKIKEGFLPHYGYYIKSNKLAIEIEMVQFENLKLNIKVKTSNTVFYITAKKVNTLSTLNKSPNENSIFSGDINFEIKVSLDDAILSSQKIESKTYEDGLLTLWFSLLEAN